MKLVSIILITILNIVKSKENKLQKLIDCFASYLPNASLRSDNSNIGKNIEKIIYCKTDSGNNDHFCKYEGTNYLIDYYENDVEYYFNCQMETCNAWDVAHTEKQQECLNKLFN